MAIETPFANVLDTNYAPSLGERAIMKALILEPEERICQLEEEISRLEAERNKLKRFVDRHRALLAPFRRLPEDVWREIFAFCLPDNELGLSLRCTSQAPLLLTTICRSWRDIALNTPRLWNSIHIYVPSPSFMGPAGMDRLFQTLRNRKEGLERWLQRSGSLPLTISMSVEPSDPEHECRLDIDAINTEFMEVYMKYSRRWRTLVLGSAGPHLTTLCRLGVDDIPQLETVRTSSSTVLFRRHEQGIRLAPAGELVTHARSLRTLHITSEWISVQVLTFPLGWSSLTVLRITSPMWQPLEPGRFELGIFLQTLAEQCKSLIVFSLKNFLSYDSELLQPPSPSSLTLVSWTTIREFIFSARGSVNEIFTESIRNALEQIALPGVESLSIAYCDDIIRDPTNSDSDIPAAPWEKLLLSSQPHIHHLELDFPRSHWGIRALLQSLKPLVTLKSLRIGHERAWDMGYEELLRGLREPFEDGLLCPELEELVLEGCVANDVEILPTLVDRHFLTSRPNLKLIRANFGFQIEYDDAARSALSSIQDKNGFDVSAMQREIVLTRKVELGATVILTFGRFHNSAGHHDRPNSGMPGSGRWY